MVVMVEVEAVDMLVEMEAVVAVVVAMVVAMHSAETLVEDLCVISAIRLDTLHSSATTDSIMLSLEKKITWWLLLIMVATRWIPTSIVIREQQIILPMIWTDLLFRISIKERSKFRWQMDLVCQFIILVILT
ncbi:hypothetical protein GUJ93_ZPchr0004g38246 [Zizania palustris]|uniref:Uncharacterized protein n=1 Tax=Zizania palustris TaxID=103762 RepID=A0A8J5V8U4_ZIZPA|nr:hypothetical protein GUJ93_ZPchr0004g38246 [Zizania palustris]